MPEQFLPTREEIKLDTTKEKKIDEKYLIVEIGSGILPILSRLRPARLQSFKDQVNAHYLGIDLNFDHLNSGKNQVHEAVRDVDPTLLDRVNFVQADGARLPLADSSVDELIIKNVFCDPRISDEKKLSMVSELLRTLRTSGRLKLIESYSPQVAIPWVQELEKHFSLQKSITDPKQLAQDQDADLMVSRVEGSQIIEFVKN